MTTIHANDLKPGDIVAYQGRWHRVTHVDRRGGWAWPVAYGDGWAMALGDVPVVVDRVA